jgi:hypothetical protein
MFKGSSLGTVLGTACATWAVGLPIALLGVLYFLDGLIWLLESLPQN